MEISSEIMLPLMENSLMMRLEEGGGGAEEEQEGHHHQCCGRNKCVAGKCEHFSYCGFSKIFSYFVLSIVFLSALDVTSALRYCHQLSDSGGVSLLFCLTFLWFFCV